MLRLGARTPRPSQHFSHLGENFIAGVRLREKGCAEIAESVSRQHLCRMCRHKENALIWPLRHDCAREFDAVGTRHHHIEHDQIHPPTGMSQDVKRLVGVSSLEYPVSLLTEDAKGYPPRNGLIVNYENRDNLRRQGLSHQKLPSLEGLSVSVKKMDSHPYARCELAHKG